jgi:ABC-type lipoprotein release transport system permease subunit
VLRALIHHWRVNLAVLLAAAVATAVLTGALLVGDSVRGSLRDLTLDRLGAIDLAVISPRFFRASLAEDLAARPGFSEVFTAAVPAIRLRAAAVHADSGTRASSIHLHGVDERFPALFSGGASGREASKVVSLFPRADGQTYPSVLLNDALARDLGAGEGDTILVSFERAEEVPRDTLLGRREPTDVAGQVRLVVRQVIPDVGMGRFALSPHQGAPLNAFVELAELQRLLERPGEVNGLFVAGRGGDTEGPAAGRDQAGQAGELLRQALRPDDLGLKLTLGDGVLAVESREFVLRPHIAEALERAAGELDLPARRIQTYLANQIRLAEKSIPYSTVTALDTSPRPAPFRPLTLADGTPAPTLADGELLLNTWAAEDLGAKPGDEIEMSYYVVGPREELTTRTNRFQLRGIVAMEGLGADAALTPDYPGIQDADDIASWDPPFPIDLALVRRQDEVYWDWHGATPKGFVSAPTGARLWSTRYGNLTAIRFAVGPTGTAEAAEATTVELRRAFLEAVDLEPNGFRFQLVKQEGLAAKGATDFSGLFLGFSFFLIVSAALLVGLLFSLGVERRASEVGLLLAVGYPLSRVRRRLLGEGTTLAATGALLGVAGGVLYAGAMMTALRTIWRPAVGSSSLFLHVGGMSLALGWLISVLVVVAAVWWSVRRLARLPAPVLLSGSTRLAAATRRRRITPVLAYGGIVAAVVLLGSAVATGASSSPGLAFGIGAALLVAGLAFFALWCRDPGRGGVRGRGAGALTAMAARNSSWNPGRSILSLALVACASFVILIVASNRQKDIADVENRDSGTGGFTLLARSSVPLHHDLNRAGARFDLGLGADADELLEQITVYPFRLLPGSDASCLNLYQPEKPQVLGVPPELIRRGGFVFQATGREVDNGWELLDDEIEPGVIPAIADAGSAQWILHLGLGDDVVLDSELGEEVRLRLVGLLQKSIFQSELLIAEDRLLEHFPSRNGYSYFLIEGPGGVAAEAGQVLEAGLGRFGFDTTSTARKLADYQAVENTYLSTFQALGGLGLLLGTVGLGVVLARNVLERRRELATLRAFGYRRRRLAAMVVAENAFLLVMGVLIGSLSALLAVTPRLLSGELELPWASLGGTLALVLAVGMLSSLAAVLGTLRVPLLPVLKTER